MTNHQTICRVPFLVCAREFEIVRTKMSEKRCAQKFRGSLMGRLGGTFVNRSNRIRIGFKPGYQPREQPAILQLPRRSRPDDRNHGQRFANSFYGRLWALLRFREASYNGLPYQVHHPPRGPLRSTQYRWNVRSLMPKAARPNRRYIDAAVSCRADLIKSSICSRILRGRLRNFPRLSCRAIVSALQ